MLYSVKLIQSNTQKNQVKQVFFVIKKKTLKKAVDRNRVKRLARNAYRDAVKLVGQEPTRGIIFFLERDMIRALYSDIVDQMVADISNTIKK
ncbi:MAG: ribonuclease P protein component [Patescibacteria group bacterium]